METLADRIAAYAAARVDEAPELDAEQVEALRAVIHPRIPRPRDVPATAR